MLRLVTGFLTLGLVTAAAAPALVGPDYSFFPRDPSVMEKQLAATKITLGQAIEAASKAAPGVVASAERKREGDAWIYEVQLYGGGKAQRVVVDGTTGVAKATETPAFKYPGDPVTGEWVALPSGLWYSDLKVGTGAQPASPSTTVSVHYSGWLNDGTRFDSSVERGTPIDFALNGVIKGWTEGVQSMKVGGKRKLVIPAALGYGDNGRPPAIPAKATLIFDVELLGTK